MKQPPSFSPPSSPTKPPCRFASDGHSVTRLVAAALAFVCACADGSVLSRGARLPKEPATSVSADSSNASSDDVAVQTAARLYLDLVTLNSPELATSFGLHARDAELDDRTTTGHEAATVREEAMLTSLKVRFKSARLSPAGQTDLAMLLGALEVSIQTKRTQRPLERQPDLYTSPLNALFSMTARDYAEGSVRAKNVVARLEKVPRIVAAAKANLLHPPRIWTEIGIDRASSATSFLESQRAFLHSALPSERTRTDLALHGAEAAYVEYKTFLENEVLPRSTGRFEAGRELFCFLLKNDYFLDETPEELRAMGAKLVAETNAQMTEVAKRVDPNAKGWPEVVAKLKGHHPTASGLLDAYRDEVQRARLFLGQKNVVAFPPGDDLEVVDTPPFMRSTVTAAYDQPPAFDAVTKGFFFVTPVDASLPAAKQEEMLRENDHGDLVDTAVHEAYPGHHLQLSFARRHPSLVRKVLDHAIFSEGWALYAEELMAELGYYTDEERLLQLEWTLVRAARVVIDVGLHVGGMTFEQAVAMLTDDVHLERQLAISEVKRYTLTPTQPLAYLTGRQMIFAMRERYRKREGATFSLKGFHTEVLTRGTVPPSLMAKEIFGAVR